MASDNINVLASLVPGEVGIITKVKGYGAFRKRITEMGFVPGTAVKVIKKAPLGDPMELELMGYRISLRKNEANLIEIVSWLPKQAMSKESFRDYMSTHYDGDFFHTAYQLACQMALYYEDNEQYIPRFDHVPTEEEALALIRKLLSYIPQNNLEEAPFVECTDPIDRLEDSLNDIIPDSPNKPYDMYEVISAVVDNGEFLEIQKDYAKNIIIGFARFGGQSVGIVANQPKFLAGVLDCNASRKGARFVRFCDAFNIPIVTLVDVPGFLPGTGQEYNAVILHGAKLLYAYGEATVPKVTVTLRKSYGGSHIVMSCKQLRGDMNYAWPTAEIAVMGGAGAVEVLYAREAKEQADPAAFLAEKEAEYTKLFANPYNAAKYGYIDDVIEPRNTRFRVIRALQQLQTKKLTNPAKKHGNIPL